MKKIDINNWNRKKHYDWFNTFSNPTYGMNVRMDVTKLYHYVKKQKQSFFIGMLYLVTKGCNMVESMRLRTINNEVLIFESIDFATSADRVSAIQYSIDYLQDYKSKGGVYFAEFRDVTPGSVFSLKFLNGRGDITVQIPYNGSYYVNIFDDPLVSVILKSVPTATTKMTGMLDVGYYGVATVGDFSDIRKVAIKDENYTQYGRCDY